MVEIYFLPWLRFCLCAATAACWPALSDRMLPAAYAICLFALLMRGDSRVLAGSAGQNASAACAICLFALLLCGDSRVLAGSAGQRAPVAAAPVRENKFPTSQKKILGI